MLTLNDRNKWQLSSSLIQGVNCSDQGDKMCVDEMSQNTVQGGLSSRFGGQSQGRVQGGWSCELWKKWPEGSLKDVDRTWLGREECGGRGGHLTQYFPSLAVWQDHPGERLQIPRCGPTPYQVIQMLWDEARASSPGDCDETRGLRTTS